MLEALLQLLRGLEPLAKEDIGVFELGDQVTIVNVFGVGFELVQRRFNGEEIIAAELSFEETDAALGIFTAKVIVGVPFVSRVSAIGVVEEMDEIGGEKCTEKLVRRLVWDGQFNKMHRLGKKDGRSGCHRQQSTVI
jgi:hypothetical protein